MRDFALALLLFWVVVAVIALLTGLYMLFGERSVYESIGCGKCKYVHQTDGHTRFTTYVKLFWHTREHWRKSD